MNLYHVYSIVSRYSGYKDVQFTWFMDKRANLAAFPPLADLISDCAELPPSMRVYTPGSSR
jgi:hypothetical protein